MICEDPFMKGVIACGCGRCLPCKINRRRLWSHRIMLESLMHKASCFVTLTYSEESVPCDGSLRIEDYQKFLKRLRKMVPNKLRFFLAGEYGEKKNRPHFHLAIFGLDYITAGGPHGISGLVQTAWSKRCGNFMGIPVYKSLGYTTVGTLTFDSAQYIAGYITKKYSKGNLWKKKKEFCRMSLRPGIGATAMEVVAESLKSIPKLSSVSDVPTVLRNSGKLWPLGRYLRRKCREALGRGGDTPPAILDEYRKKMQDMFREDVGNSTDEKERYERSLGRRFRNKKKYVDTNAQKVLNMKSKFEIYKSEKKL